MQPENIFRMIEILNAIIYNNDKKANKLLCELSKYFINKNNFLAFIFKFGRFTNNMLIIKSQSTKEKEKIIRNKWIEYFESIEIQNHMKKNQKGAAG